MTTMSAQLKADYAAGTRTIARCWRLERRDGLVRTVTNIDENITYLGEVYEARPGVSPAAMQQAPDASVANSEIVGAMATDSIEEDEIVAGLWDGAFVTIFELNYRALSHGRAIIGTGTIGNVQAGRLTFNAELRGLAQYLQQVIGELYTKNCQATLGDNNCRVDLGPFTETGTLSAAASRRVVTDSARGEAADWYGAGVLTMIDGLNAGISMEIAEFTGGEFQLALPLPFNPSIGDQYQVVAGCRKRHARNLLNPAGVSDCKDKFDNVINFYLGFPFVPGGDKVLGLGGTEGTNL